MDFQTTPIQRDFYIEELFNSDSNSKYSLNFIFKLESSNALSIDQVRQSIVDVIQNQPIMSGIADIKDSNVIIRKGKLKNSVVEIETVQNSNIIFEDDSIFQHTFSLIDHQPLFRCKLIDKEGSLYILLAVHHLVLSPVKLTLIKTKTQFFLSDQIVVIFRHGLVISFSGNELIREVHYSSTNLFL